MNGKPGTRAEVEALRAARDFCAGEGLPFATHLSTLYDKLTAPFKARDTGPNMLEIERVLVEASGGTVIKVEAAGPGWWASLSRRCEDRGVTPATAEVIGRWLTNQPWAQGMTVDRVAAGWPSYAARARADGRGLSADTGREDFDPRGVAH